MIFVSNQYRDATNLSICLVFFSTSVEWSKGAAIRVLVMVKWERDCIPLINRHRHKSSGRSHEATSALLWICVLNTYFIGRLMKVPSVSSKVGSWRYKSSSHLQRSKPSLSEARSWNKLRGNVYHLKRRCCRLWRRTRRPNSRGHRMRKRTFLRM